MKTSSLKIMLPPCLSLVSMNTTLRRTFSKTGSDVPASAGRAAPETLGAGYFQAVELRQKIISLPADFPKPLRQTLACSVGQHPAE